MNRGIILLLSYVAYSLHHPPLLLHKSTRDPPAGGRPCVTWGSHVTQPRIPTPRSCNNAFVIHLLIAKFFKDGVKSWKQIPSWTENWQWFIRRHIFGSKLLSFFNEMMLHHFLCALASQNFTLDLTQKHNNCTKCDPYLPSTTPFIRPCPLLYLSDSSI
ncbi:hypothetical protein FHG87_016257 [Trinorchestia longiramus]|nr:hypothetical protein FHG87_016257 [Trinorchestia longiramus]